MTKLELGKIGEDKVCEFLKQKHYYIIKRNFRCKSGEIDIIAIDREELVFVEVKTRCSKNYGEAREAVDWSKKKSIKRAADFFIYKYHQDQKFIRFDVIEVYVKNGKFYISQIKNTLW